MAPSFTLFGLAEPTMDPTDRGEYTVKSGPQFMSSPMYAQIVHTNDPSTREFSTVIESKHTAFFYKSESAESTMIFCIVRIRTGRTLLVFRGNRSGESTTLQGQVTEKLGKAYLQYLKSKKSHAHAKVNYSIEHLESITSRCSAISIRDLLWELQHRYGGWCDQAEEYFYAFGIKHSIGCIRSIFHCAIDIFLADAYLLQTVNRDYYRAWLECTNHGIGRYECPECSISCAEICS